MDYENILKSADKEAVFIKTVAKPAITGEQKAALNRKGNVLYNSGDIEGARRIYLTTGYSDGISRIGDYYKAHGKPLDALRMYWMAPDKTKARPILENISVLIQNLIQDDKENMNE